MVPQGELGGRRGGAPGLPRVLVTGAGGLLGRAIGRTWEGAAELVLCDRAGLDVTDAEGVRDALDRHRPDVVLNTAAFTDVDDAERDPEGAERLNHGACRLLAAACARRGILLIAISSDYVFDGSSTRPYHEEDPQNPLSVYGKTKQRGEDAVRAAGVPHLVVRAQALYGPGRPSLVTRLLAMEDPAQEIRVVNDRTSQPTFVDHFARGVLTLWRRGAQGTFHVANTGPMSWYGFALLVREETGLPRGQVKTIGSRERGEVAARPPYSALDTGRFAGVAGRPMATVREGLREYLAGLGVTRA
ncbi:MAG: dTDP-4-dehydrorhamnose reductase [Planctomycetaceae bacterium]